jgi:hypothetical protein
MMEKPMPNEEDDDLRDTLTQYEEFVQGAITESIEETDKNVEPAAA